MKFRDSVPGLVGAVMLVVCLPSIAIAQSGSRQSSGDRSEPAASSTVVELFTSQGCSSCPPADSLLREIATRAANSKLPVYVLSFHVDYWNRLGWNDPYSDQKYSNRQRDYSIATGGGRVYTPQMIVGGTTEFVGSDKSKAFSAVANSLRRSPGSRVAIKVESLAELGRLKVRYAVERAASGQLLNFAVVQSPKANEVPRGENAGRKLAHVNVVRSFKTVKLDRENGTVQLELPDDLDLSNSGLIDYVQNPNTRAIQAATSVRRLAAARQ